MPDNATTIALVKDVRPEHRDGHYQRVAIVTVKQPDGSAFNGGSIALGGGWMEKIEPGDSIRIEVLKAPAAAAADTQHSAPGTQH